MSGLSIGAYQHSKKGLPNCCSSYYLWAIYLPSRSPLYVHNVSWCVRVVYVYSKMLADIHSYSSPCSHKKHLQNNFKGYYLYYLTLCCYYSHYIIRKINISIDYSITYQLQYFHYHWPALLHYFVLAYQGLVVPLLVLYFPRLCTMIVQTVQHLIRIHSTPGKVCILKYHFSVWSITYLHIVLFISLATYVHNAPVIKTQNCTRYIL